MSRIDALEMLIRNGALESEPRSKTYPPCSRSDNNNDDEEYSCAFVYFYALGVLGKKGQREFDPTSVARLHNVKGQLFVVFRKPLPDSVRRAFCRAWKYVRSEESKDVNFVSLGSSDWRNVWTRKKFESDWSGAID